MKNQRLLFIGIFSLLLVLLHPPRAEAQTLGVKTDAVGLATYGTLNLGVEIGFARHWSFEIDGAYNPFSWSRHRKTHLWALQGEFRYWFRHKFSGHFIGAHGHYGEYDWGIRKYRYKGDMYGAGISYGYSWMLNKRWNIEGNLGFGFTRLAHDYKYDRRDDRISHPVSPETFWGPSRVGIRITYLIK